jgi:hypothetical protein
MATKNRCPHVGGPENAECGCPLDFDCPHNGTCETKQDCIEFDEYNDDAQMAAEFEAEQRNERYWEEGPHGGYYAGSEEEARDRFYDGLMGL